MLGFVFVLGFQIYLVWIQIRDAINGKAGKAAALPKFSDTLNLSQSEGADYALQLALSDLIFFHDNAPAHKQVNEDYLLLRNKCQFSSVPTQSTHWIFGGIAHCTME